MNDYPIGSTWKIVGDKGFTFKIIEHGHLSLKTDCQLGWIGLNEIHYWKKHNHIQRIDLADEEH
jgi:hypothetical protein